MTAQPRAQDHYKDLWKAQGGGHEIVTQAQAEGAIEGSGEEYKMTGFFETKYKYSRFSVLEAPVRDVAKLAGTKREATRPRPAAAILPLQDPTSPPRISSNSLRTLLSTLRSLRSLLTSAPHQATRVGGDGTWNFAAGTIGDDEREGQNDPPVQAA